MKYLVATIGKIMFVVGIHYFVTAGGFNLTSIISGIVAFYGLDIAHYGYHMRTEKCDIK